MPGGNRWVWRRWRDGWLPYWVMTPTCKAAGASRDQSMVPLHNRESDLQPSHSTVAHTGFYCGCVTIDCLLYISEWLTNSFMTNEWSISIHCVTMLSVQMYKGAVRPTYKHGHNGFAQCLCDHFYFHLLFRLDTRIITKPHRCILCFFMISFESPKSEVNFCY